MPKTGSKRKAPAQKRKFCLLRWVGEETVSVLPDTSIRPGQKAYPRAIGEFKWLHAYYEAEVLKVSENRQELLKDMDRLTKLEISREDILKAGETAVDSTTDEDTPVKEPPKKSIKKAKIAAAKERATEIFSRDLEKEQLRNELADLKRKLAVKQDPPGMITVQHNVVTNSNFEALQKSTYQGSARTPDEEGQKDLEDAWSIDEYQDPMETQTSPTPNLVPMQYTPLAAPPKSSLVMKHHHTPSPAHSSKPASSVKKPTLMQNSDLNRSLVDTPNRKTAVAKRDGTFKVEPCGIELVEGYGVFLKQRQLDACLEGSGTATKLIRNLLSVFFNADELACSSALGKKTHPELDRDIVDACIKFVQNKFEHTTRSILIDAINDKCANYRRKQHTRKTE